MRQHGGVSNYGALGPRNMDRLEILAVVTREYVEVSKKYPHRADTRVCRVRVPPSVSLYKSCFGDFGRI